MKKAKCLAGLMIFVQLAFSQISISPEAAVVAALQNHPSVKAAGFEVQAKQFGEKSALNLPNPEINVESPTGEFYAVGVSQSFEFPTVYVRQKNLAKAETALAKIGQQVSENDLRYVVRSLYLEAQVADYQAKQWAGRDSLYQKVAAAAARQFAAGEIDFVQKTLTENEAGNIRQSRVAADLTAEMLHQQLAALTGLADFKNLQPLAPDTLGLIFSENAAATNPAIAYKQQTVQVAERQIGLAKSRALPNFSLGYLNQGARNTSLDYRFRASVGVPLWARQYRAGVNLAEAENQAALAHAAAQSQTIALELERSRSEMRSALALLRYHEQEALPRSRVLIAAALRMREAGQTDYPAFLRTLDTAFDIPREYAAQVQAFENARIRVLYLSGQ